VVILVYSRYALVWPLIQHTVEATIEGLDQTWRFFGALAIRLVLDNFPAAVAGPDKLNPRPTHAFLEYSQARGLILDPARVPSPRDKPQVEAGVKYAPERWWKSGHFRDLDDARRQFEQSCRDMAGVRVHGTTRRLPRIVFEDEERLQLRPYDGVPHDVPLWRDVTVHPDHHVSVPYTLYSAPSTTCPAGTKLEAHCNRALVKRYRAGELVKVHPRKPQGGRSTDPDDYGRADDLRAARSGPRHQAQPAQGVEVAGAAFGAEPAGLRRVISPDEVTHWIHCFEHVLLAPRSSCPRIDHRRDRDDAVRAALLSRPRRRLPTAGR
jgi:hypothetical protein